MGEYEFGTEAKEVMDILSGELDILLPGDSDWLQVITGMSFKVPEKSSFQLIHLIII